MAKYALSEAGVASKVSELYALSNTALAAEAAAIKADFADWMDDNFNLTGAQSTFIAGMASQVKTYYGEICAMAFLHRIDVDFTYPSPPPVYVGKWVQSEDAPKAKTNASGGIDVSGVLSFTIGYDV